MIATLEYRGRRVTSLGSGDYVRTIDLLDALILDTVGALLDATDHYSWSIRRGGAFVPSDEAIRARRRLARLVDLRMRVCLSRARVKTRRWGVT